MAERLSASDVSSLLAERGPIHVHIGGTVILEGDPALTTNLQRARVPSSFQAFAESPSGPR